MRDDNDLLQEGRLCLDPLEGTEPIVQASVEDAAGQSKVLPGLEAELRWKRDDQLASSRLNDSLLLERHPKWAGRFTWDEFRARVALDGRPLREPDLVEYANWLDVSYGVVNAPLKRIGEAVQALALKHRVNEVEEYLRGIPWDGEPRIAGWLVDALAADDTPLNREYGRRWFIQAAARALRPGCQADTVLVLVGPQGLGKSTAFRLMVGSDWFNDTDIDMKNKDRFQQIHSAWVHELSELASFRRARSDAIKSFVTSKTDRFRPPYGRNVEDFPRRCVLVATTNEAAFLRDASGSRRFWPVAVRELDRAWIVQHRDQLWAEAVHQFQAGERWWLDEAAEAERRGEAEGFTESDPWEEPVREWLETADEPVQMRDVLSHACGLATERQDKAAQARVAAILKQAGWQRRAGRIDRGGRSVSTKLWWRS